MKLPFATAFTPDLLTVAEALLRGLYRPGYRYKRAGVLLSELQPQEVRQPDLFAVYAPAIADRQACLMHTVDAINRIWGRDTLFFGAQGMHRKWRLFFDEDLPTVCFLEVMGQRWRAIFLQFFTMDRRARLKQLRRQLQKYRQGTLDEVGDA